MDFLALCKSLRSEAGIAGSGPTTTAGQSGELGRIVEWIKQAYVDIQDEQANWDFLRNDFSLDTVAGTSTYAKSSVSNLATWKNDSLRCYLKSSGVNDEMWLKYEPWDIFRDTRLRGANRNAQGRPLYFSIKPDKSLILWPVPNDIYTVVGEYFRTAIEFANNTDTPAFERHHMLIVFDALMRYAAYVGEPSLYARGEKERKKLMIKLQRDYLPGIMLGAPLA